MSIHLPQTGFTGRIGRALSPAYLIVGALTTSSCGILPSHFHDEKAAALSTKLQTEFAVYREDQSSLYANMATNLASFQTEEDELLSRFATAFQTALITKAPNLSWNKLDEEIEDVEGRRKGFDTKILDRMKEDLIKRGVNVAEVSSAEKGIAKYKKKIKDGKAEAEKWQASISTLQEALSDLPEDLQALGDKATGLDLIKDLPSELTEKLPNSIVDAPGIAVRILELGLELAELRKRRAQSELTALQLRDDVFQEAFVHSRIARILLNEALVMSATAADEPQRDTSVVVSILQVKESMGTSSQDVLNSTDRMTSRLYALRAYATGKWLVGYQESVLPVRLARLDHQRSISRSEENDQAWQAIIASGIDGLAEYHKGGVKTEDIANIIRLAQSIALFIIAS